MSDQRIQRLLDLGLRFHADGDPTEAANCFRQVLGLDPENAAARQFLLLVTSGRPLGRNGSQGPKTPGAVEMVVEARSAVDGLEMLENSGPRPPLAVPEVRREISRGPVRAEADTLMEGARELFGLGDFSGSLRLVEQALALDPVHPEASAYLERNRDTLIHMYESKLGTTRVRPRVILRPDEIVWLNLDHRAGFVLAQIDGTITVEDLYALSGLSRLDTARILAELLEQGVIST
ncbi:MAG TPA: tetratricopeptide repeat protein [Vulgatibacter sp.]